MVSTHFAQVVTMEISANLIALFHQMPLRDLKIYYNLRPMLPINHVLK